MKTTSMHEANAQAMATVVLTAILLSACTTPSVTERADAEHAARQAAVASATAGTALAEQAGPAVRGGQADANRRALEQASDVVLRRASRPWITGTSVPYASDQLPSIFGEPLKLNFTDRPGIRTVAERLTTLTGVPIRVKADAVADPAGGGARLTSAGASPQIALRESGVNALPMQWSGTLASYLNHVADLSGLSWEYRDGAVVIEKFRTEFFELTAFDGETEYSVGMTGSDAGTGGTGGAGGNSASSASSDIKEKGKVNAIETVIKTVKQIVQSAPGSEVIRAEGSGRVVVTTTRDTMGKVRDFIRAENLSLQRQAQVQFDIYSVRRSEGDQRGVDWDGVFQSMSRALGVTVTSPTTLTGSTAAGLGFSILTPSQAPGSDAARRFGGSKAMVALLSEFGTTTEHRPVSLLGLNRQWARKASLTSQAYVSETTPGVATSAGTGAPGLKTSTVTTGDRYVAMPYVLENGNILLQFGIGLSTLVDLPEFSSGTGTSAQKVQTPETGAVVDQARVLLKAGQILAITGLSRVVAADSKRTLGEGTPIGLGGSKTVNRQREDFVILVRSTVL